jgi:hypothetical protein
VTFKELGRQLEAARLQRDQYFSRLYGLDTVEDFSHVEQRDLDPSNPYYTIQLFYNPAKFSTAASRRQLTKHLAAAKSKYVGRDVELRPISADSLTYRSMSLFPDTEKHFTEFGYVIDVEHREKNSGRRAHLLVASHNIDVLRINAHHWGRMLLEGGTSLGLWTRAPLEKERDRLFEAMAPIMGCRTAADVGKNKTEATIPLIEHEGILLGGQSVKKRIVHIAYAVAPGTVAEHGRREYQTLFSDQNDLAQEQMAFELANAYQIFEGNDPRLTNNASDTGDAILTWFSQVVVAQRKICWLLKSKQDWSLALKQLKREKDDHAGPTGVTKLPKKIKEAQSWSELLASELDEHAENIQSSIGQRPDPKEIKHEVTLQEYILAALHGSTIDLGADNEHEFFQSGSHLIALAHWIGTLKRTGQQTFGKSIARCLCIGWADIEAGQNVLLGQFPMEVWRLLLQRSKGFFAPLVRAPNKLPRFDYRGFEEAKPISVRYDWITEETLRAPRCRATARTIALRGPMLCLPVHQIDHWKRRADVVRHHHGFTV